MAGQAENLHNHHLSCELAEKRVLIVEDSPDNQLLIQEFLKLEGVHAEVVDNGKDGVTLALASDFDCILMDVQMPGIDGLEATRLLRDKGYNKPIIAITAHALGDEKSRCLAAGCDSYIAKPFDAFHLIDVIREYICRKTATSW